MALLSIPTLALIALGLIAARLIISGVRSPLSHVPGPWYSRFTHRVLWAQTIAGRRIHYVDYLHRLYGPVVRIAPDEVDVSDVDAFAKIHRTGAGYLKGPWYDGIIPGREPGIFVMRDPRQHAARRRLFAQAFSNSALQRNWESEIRSKAEKAVSRIKVDAVAGDADVLKWWTLMATDVIAHLSFGESFGMLDLGKQTPYIDAVQSALLVGVLRNELPLVYSIARWLPFRSIQSLVTADDVVYQYGGKAVQNMRAQSANHQNLFGQMVAEGDSQEKTTVTDDMIRSEAGNLIVAGSDTTAVTLTYLVWAVLKDPELHAQLAEEVAKLSPALESEELQNAPLLNSVIHETLRLYGAAPGSLPRVVPGDGADLGGHFLPGGTVVSTQAFTLHRDPDIFPDPLRFDGYRFFNKAAMSPTQKIAFSPFGAGSRICLGIHLAWMELRIATALFFRECRGAIISPSMTDAMMELDNRFLISPKGHSCKITLRDPPCTAS
ncbi:cytochrome P450 [Thozetella sp. PMI_491]|nr:cytochrome P450 [Thozetella sp. PMI_491]